MVPKDGGPIPVASMGRHERLWRMLRFGILERTVQGEKPPVEVGYLLTPFGHRFLRIIDEVRRLQSAVDDGRVGGSSER